MSRPVLDSVLLLLPGLVAAGGFAAFPTGGVPGLHPNLAAEFLVFLPWHLLCLTACKFGIDSWVLARANNWRSKRMQLRHLLLARVIPVATVGSGLLLARFESTWVIVSAFCLVADAVALVRAAELSAHGHLRRAAQGHFLKYPLFFSAVYLIGALEKLTVESLLAAFAAGSALRLVFYSMCLSKSPPADVHVPKLFLMARQQLLNYGLFKNDQLSFAFGCPPAPIRDLLVFCARFPELVSAAVVALGPVLYPRIVGQGPSSASASNSSRTILLVVSALITLVGAAAYATLAPAWTIQLLTGMIAVACNGSLVLPVSAQTFKMFSEGREAQLVRTLLVANGVGIALLAAILLTTGTTAAVLFVVPLQQGLFLMLARRSMLATPSGRRG